MLARYLFNGPLKGPASTKPFVDDDTQCILIAGNTWSPAHLFWCCIQDSTLELLHLLYAVAHPLRHNRNAKITQHHLVVCSQQHIVRLDIAVNQALIVHVL